MKWRMRREGERKFSHSWTQGGREGERKKGDVSRTVYAEEGTQTLDSHRHMHRHRHRHRHRLNMKSKRDGRGWVDKHETTDRQTAARHGAHAPPPPNAVSDWVCACVGERVSECVYAIVPQSAEEKRKADCERH